MSYVLCVACEIFSLFDLIQRTNFNIKTQFSVPGWLTLPILLSCPSSVSCQSRQKRAAKNRVILFLYSTYRGSESRVLHVIYIFSITLDVLCLGLPAYPSLRRAPGPSVSHRLTGEGPIEGPE